MTINLEKYNHALRATLIRLESPNSTELAPLYLYYTDFARDITVNNIVYKSDVVKSIKNIKFSRKLTAHKVKVGFSGLIEEQLNIALDNGSSFLNKTLRISQVFLDPKTEDNLLTTEDITLFEGLITGSSLVDKNSGSNNSSVLEWECANHFQDFQQVVGRITDDYAHRGMIVENGKWAPSIATKRPEYAYDKGFFHANKSASFLAQYQTIENGFKMVKKKNWHGLTSDYRMVEYTQEVTKEVDLRFDLSAKFIPIVYGTQKVPAIPIFADTEKNDPSSVWVAYAVCEGEIEGFYDFYLDDAPIICFSPDELEDDARICFGSKKTKGSTLNNSIVPNQPDRPAATTHGEHYTYNDGKGDVHFWVYHGKSNQRACSVLVDKASKGEFYLQEQLGMDSDYWDNTFKVLDTAYVVFNFKLSDIDGGRTTIPSLDVEVKGLKVNKYANGRLVSTNKTSTNPAWQLLDYLTSHRYGMSLSYADIDLNTFEDVANKFNRLDTSYETTWVPFWRYVGWDNNDSSNRKIMQTNVVFPSEETIFKNVNALLEQVKCSLNKFSGKYILQVESDNPSVLDLDLDDIAIGDIQVKDLTGTKKYNTVSASIADPGKGWETNTITFYDNQYKMEDRGVEKKLNLSFPFITNYYTARSLVDRELRKSRFSRSVIFTIPYHYLGRLLPNNNITLSYGRYEWDKKEFIVDDIDIQYSGNIRVTALEFPRSVFVTEGQANVGDEQNPTVDISVLPARELKFTPASEMEEPGPNVNGRLSWLPSISPDISHYTVYWDGAPEVYLVPKPVGGNPLTRVYFDVVDLALGSYTFSVKAVSSRGAFSAPALLLVGIDPSKYLPDVENFKVENLEPGYTDSFIRNYVQLSWDKINSTNTGIIYRLQILDKNDTILRDVKVPGTDESFLYTLALNKADFANLNGTVGAFRSLRFKIRAEGDGGAASINWSKIS